MSNDFNTPSPSQALSEPRLPLARYRLSFKARDHITLPPFQGKLWRSVFGLALKALSDRAAANGRDAEGQLYRYFFETLPPSDSRMPFSKDAPHPYVIAAEANSEPWTFAPGQPLFLEVTLIGRGVDAAPIVFEAFTQAAGLGESRARADLTAVDQVWPDAARRSRETIFVGGAASLFPQDGRISAVPTLAESPVIPLAPEIAEVHLVTPLRITRDNRLIRPDGFRAEHLLVSLVHRVSNLMTLHAGEDRKPDFAGLTKLAKQAAMLEPRLQFQDQSRWSARQHAEMPMGGIVGSFTLDMRGLAPFWPYLWLGQWVHAGKGTVMGLGALRIHETHTSE